MKKNKKSIILTIKTILFMILVLSMIGVMSCSNPAAGNSDNGTNTETPRAAAPQFSVNTGTYSTDQSVKITTATENAAIFYSIDGSNPTSASLTYSDLILIAGPKKSVTIKAMAKKEGMIDSAVTSVTIAVQYNKCPDVGFSLAEGTYISDQTIELTTDITGASIYYTLDGNTPASSSTLYSSPILIAGNGTTITVKAFVSKEGMVDSNIKTMTYNINYGKCSIPNFSEPEGIYAADQLITITALPPDADIYYTINGTVPDKTATLYTGPVSIAGHGTTITLKAIAIKTGVDNSDVQSAQYVINYDKCKDVTFSVPAGTYSSDQTVVLETQTDGADIYYTTNGAEPDTGSILYTGSIVITGHKTVKNIRAIAIKDGMVNSSVTNTSYTINYGTCAAPTFSYAGGTHPADRYIELKTTSQNAVIYYTIDGTTPDRTKSLYKNLSPIGVVGNGTSLTIKAIAVYDGMLDDSEVVEATYTIVYPQCTAPIITPDSGRYTDLPTITIAAGTGLKTIRYTSDGTDPRTSKTAESKSSKNVYEDLKVVLIPRRSLTIKAVVSQSKMSLSNVITKTYTLVPEITRLSGRTQGGNLSSSTIKIKGKYFGKKDQITVKLTKAGQADITAVVNSVSYITNEIDCTVNLEGKALGKWNVVVTNPDLESATLTNGFEIVRELERVDTNSLSNESSIITDNLNTLHAVFNETLSEVDSFKHGVRNSGTWTTESIEDGISVWSSSLTADKNNKLHVVYIDNSDTLKYAHNISGSWVVESIKTEPLSSVYHANVKSAIDTNNKIHIVYYTFRRDSYSGNTYIDYFYATNKTGTWEHTPVAIYDYGKNSSLFGAHNYASIQLDKTNNPHIIFIDGYKLVYTTNKTGSWVTELITTADSGFAYGKPKFTTMGMDSLNNLHMVYSSGDYARYVNNKSGSWSAPAVFMNYKYGDGKLCSLSIDKNDTLHLVSLSTQNGSHYTDVYLVHNIIKDVSTYSTILRRFPGPNHKVLEGINTAIDSTNRIYVTSSNNDGELFFQSW